MQVSFVNEALDLPGDVGFLGLSHKLGKLQLELELKPTLSDSRTILYWPNQAQGHLHTTKIWEHLTKAKMCVVCNGPNSFSKCHSTKYLNTFNIQNTDPNTRPFYKLDSFCLGFTNCLVIKWLV
jgi:hypothetical protein